MVQRERDRYTTWVLRKWPLLAVLALAVALSMPQASAAATQPDERAAAREFSYAAYRLRVAIRAQDPAIEQAARILSAPDCLLALGLFDDVPAKAQDDVSAVATDMLAGAAFAPIAAPLRTFAAELDAIATADPALRSGRATWRSDALALAQARPLPRKVCATLRRWRLKGYRDADRPHLQPAAVRRALTKDGSRAERRLRRAAARMVQLGVTRGQARRFTGDTLFDGVGEAVFGG